ncbi:GNAT family N-acetyltransferase [Lacticaseibacillus saniviri]
MLDIKTTQDLDSQTYRDALMIRQTVFVNEQGVDPKLEIDADEAKAIYFVGYLNQQPVVTARLIDGNHIQRVATMKAFRHQGLAKELLLAMEAPAKALGATELHLNAQLRALPFYERLGYHAFGPEFMDAGIAHRAMSKPLN